MFLFDGVKYYINKDDIPKEEIVDIDRIENNDGIVTFVLDKCNLGDSYWIKFTLKNKQKAIVRIKCPELWENKFYPDENDTVKKIHSYEAKIDKLKRDIEILTSQAGLEDIVI